MTVSTKKHTEITDRRQKVSERYLRGMYMAQIAAELDVDTATVSRDLAELRKEWLERSINHIDQKKAIELAKLDRLEVTYWEAWERSRENAKTIIKRETPKGHFSERKTEGRDGNPAFLAGVLSCIDKRCQIIGINAPVKVAPTNPDGDKAYDPIGVSRSLSTLADALRTALSGPPSAAEGAVDASIKTPVAGPPHEGG